MNDCTYIFETEIISLEIKIYERMVSMETVHETSTDLLIESIVSQAETQ